jgi:hypothetical protein
MSVPRFFSSRVRPANIIAADVTVGLSEYENLPRTIGIVISAKKATLRDLQEFHSVHDLYDLLEVIAVDGSNQHRMMERAQRKQGR